MMVRWRLRWGKQGFCWRFETQCLVDRPFYVDARKCSGVAIPCLLFVVCCLLVCLLA